MTRLRNSPGDYVPPADVADGSIVSVFRVPPEVAGMRLDLFVKSQLRRTSRTRTQEIIALSAYSHEGKRLRSNDRVYAEQEIFLWRAPWDETPVPTDIPVVYEDEHFLAVNKPANLPVHPTARYHNNTLIMLMKAERPGEFLTLAHRIDRETSGVLLVAKSAACDRALKRQLELREGIEKVYSAITWGVPSSASGDSRFRHVQSVELDVDSRYKVKMRVGITETALFAATQFEVLETAQALGKSYARVSCLIETGRQHQIRVHLMSLGTPIVGDKLYGPDESAFARSADGELTLDDLEMLELPRHALHASRMSLRHPITGVDLTIEAPWPADMKAFWEGLASEPRT